MRDPITELLKGHYTKTFQTHGATPKGVDWGNNDATNKRYRQMLKVIPASHKQPRLLDVGCGFGGLLAYIQDQHVPCIYYGIDVVEDMITVAQKQLSAHQFAVKDIFELDKAGQFEYVVCNGILTQKLTTSQEDMDHYAKALITKMFSVARNGIAFNIKSAYAHQPLEKLYHKEPGEMLRYCLQNLTPHVILDHAYGLEEFTLYLYHAA